MAQQQPARTLRDKVSPAEARAIRKCAAEEAGGIIGNVCKHWPDVNPVVIREVLRGERQRHAGGPIAKRKRTPTPSLWPLTKAQQREFRAVRERLVANSYESIADRHADAVTYALLLEVMAKSTDKWADPKPE